MERWKMRCWSLLMLACLAACGDDSSGPGRMMGEEFAFDDPVGDTALFTGGAESSPALDVRRVRGVVGPDSLRLTLDFAAPIARATTSAPNSLIAAIAIDADDDAATGTPLDEGSGTDSSFTGPFAAETGMGAEYFVFVDPASGGDGDVVYFLFPDETVATFPVTYDDSSATLRLPLSSVGISPGARFRVMGIVGNPQRLTDIIPDEGGYALGDST